MRALRRILARIGALFTRRQDEERLREELEEHLAMLTEHNLRSGVSPAEARRQAALKFGPVEATKEAYRDRRGLPWLSALASDLVFGWRQLNKHRVASAAATLSLALAIGAATAAFRLVDAVFLRTLPLAEPERLSFLAFTFVDREGRPDYRDDFDYPTFRRYRETVSDRADLMVAGLIARQDVAFGAGDETEKSYRQYVSGNLFAIFGLQPALGRLLMPYDDLTPGAHPVAVLSYNYWTSRFGRDPGIIGKTFRMRNDRFEVVGIAPKGFTGTEPGEVTDIFIPAMMNAEAIHSPGWSWFRIWVRPKQGVSLEQVRQPLQAVFTQDHRERLNAFHSDTSRQVIEAFLREKVLLLPAAAGASGLQKEYARPLLILSFLVALVLLVACTNVANLLTAQAAARAREMALRVSIGAGRRHLVQLVLVESALLAVGASALGTLFAAWAAPLVTAMLRVPGDPVRLVLETGWRELAFSAALASLVTFLFGLPPALRASAVQPINALKGTDDPYSRRRLMNGLLVAQIAFCVLVLFVAGLFLKTFQRLSNRPLGFTAERLLIMDTSASGKEQPAAEVWMQAADLLRNTPGVQSVSLSGWALLTGNRWTGAVHLPGRAVETRPPYFLDVAPRFFETMQIRLIDGREFRSGDVPPRLSGTKQPLPGVGIVNEAFARTYFNGENPMGRSVNVRQSKDLSAPMEIVGYVGDAAYRNLREPVPPTVYVPMAQRGNGAFLVRTSGDPRALAPTLRREVSRARSDFRVRTVETQNAFVQWHLVRERLLATLSLFFAVVTLVLAAVGLYGVLNYSVMRQRREIGIRMALGARPAHVLRRLTIDIGGMLCLGSAAGLAGGLASGRFIESLLYEVRATDFGMIVAPIVTLACVAVVAALPPAIRAARIDPAQALRSD